MADYRELLRRAIAALPENNGAARRAVYEKARSALVGQLRAIDPPLPAREITQHRLQLEDCIREVEQEASEAVISFGREAARSAPVAAPEPETPASPEELAPTATQSVELAEEQPEPEPVARAEPEPPEEPIGSRAEAQPSRKSIEDIIAEAEATSSRAPAGDVQPSSEAEPVEDTSPRDDGDEAPAPEAPAKPSEALAKSPFRLFPALASRNDAPINPRPAAAEPRTPQVRLAASKSGEAYATAPVRAEPSIGNQAVARKQEPLPEQVAVIEEQPVEAALSTVREVEVEPAEVNDTREAEGAISRAIETLDRAARGEANEDEPAEEKTAPTPPPAPTPTPTPAPAPTNTQKAESPPAAEDADFVQTEPAARGGSGLTIFLIVFALLLAGVGGAGFWAWREGYIDLEQMFGDGSTAVATAETTEPDTPADLPVLDSQPPTPQPPANPQSGPGNTATETALAEPTTALEGIEGEDRLAPTPEPEPEPEPEPVPQAEPTEAEPAAAPDEEITEDRLPAETETALADDPAASVDPAVLAGSQSLLLEAADDGRTGAVPFSGTVEWSRGTDEIGLPTLVATADIPARNLGVEIIIRRNSDPSLPASHLMEINFDVADTFVGGAISSLPGVLLKDQELVQGTPLVGASARVVGNSFLFALSASEADIETNRDLLANRKWMDLAVIYGTGKRAIITLEKDDEAEELFTDVFAEWQQAANE